MTPTSNTAELSRRMLASLATPPVYADQVRLIYRLSRAGYAGSLICALIVAYALWDVVSPHLVGAWLALAVIVSAARFMLYQAYNKADASYETSFLWANRFVVGACAMGCVWGLLGSLLLPPDQPMHQVLIVFLIGGMTASAVIVLSPLRSAFLAFMLPAMVPLIIAIFMQGTTVHMLMAAMLVALVAVMLATFPIVHDTHMGTLRARFENSDLVERMSQVNRQLIEQIAGQQKTEAALQQSTERLEALIEDSPLAMIVVDDDAVVQRWNAAAEKMFGWSEAEVLGRPLPILLEGQSEEARTFRERIRHGERFADLETVRGRKDGTQISVSISAAALRNSVGEPTAMLAMYTDITERKRVELHQNIHNAITLMLAEAGGIDDALPRVIRALCESFGWVAGARRELGKDDQMMREKESWCVPVPAIEAFMKHSAHRIDYAAEPSAALVRKVWATGKPVWLSDIGAETNFARGPAALEAGLRSAFAFPISVGGDFYGVIELYGREVRPRDEEVVKIAETVASQVGQFIARKQAESNLTFFANHDALTGLPNRVMFNERLTQALARAQRYRKQLAVLFIDLDRFKVINDTLGHAAGDRLLMQLATQLRGCLRESDTIGRQGGDEFVVLIEDITDPQQVTGVAQKILETVSQPHILSEQSVHVTASIGISLYPDDGSEQQSLLKNADIAMYRAKEQGKNNLQFYSAQMNQHTFERLALETSLRGAIERQEFLVHYQPKIDMRSGRITGVEALVRWRHPELGMVAPGRFIPLAEETGLIGPIGEWVLRTACAEAQRWIEQGAAPISVAVNLSARQLAREDLAQSVTTVLRETGLEARYLELEITESTVMHNADRAATVLRQLKALGIRVAIDDFGTGYSSLGYLKRFPIDSVKIDRSFILDIPYDKDDVAITCAVIAMAHSLRLKTIAEGVETKEQFDFLRDHDCDEMQGYFFSPPIDAEALMRFLSEQPVS